MCELVDGCFSGSRGRRIAWLRWSTAGSPQRLGIVLIVPGYGEHARRYAPVAQRLCAAGFVVYGIDHHGHGRSDGRRGLIRLADALADLHQLVITVIRRRDPTLPLFLFGHSMGGLIALRYGSVCGERLDGLVLSSPLAQIDSSPTLRRLALTLGQIAPWAPTRKVDPRGLSRDRAAVTDYAGDPAVHHGRIPAVTAREFVLATERLDQDVRAIKLPTLLMWGTDDRVCPPDGAEAVAAALGSAELQVERWPGLFHELFNEPEREQVLACTIGWLVRHTAVPATN